MIWRRAGSGSRIESALRDGHISVETDRTETPFARMNDEVLIVPLTYQGDVLLIEELAPAMGRPT